MGSYDYGVFNALKKELEGNGVDQRVLPAPIPVGAVNDNEQYVSIKVDGIQQMIGVRACADIEVQICGDCGPLKRKMAKALEKIAMKSARLMVGSVEIGNVCFRVNRRDLGTNKIGIQAFIVFERIYRDEIY